MNKITKTFEITASKEVMDRFERLISLLYYSSAHGFSSAFAMHLDGDGAGKFEVNPKPPSHHRKEISVLTKYGFDCYLAQSYGYSRLKLSKNQEPYYRTQMAPTMFKNKKLDYIKENIE